MIERSTIVRVLEGLHARPATQFVKLAKGFASQIEVSRSGRSASAKSSVKLMLLSVKENDEITVRADGEDAAAALEALITFLENPDSGLEAASQGTEAGGSIANLEPAAPEGGLRGVAASEGVAIGRLHHHFPRRFAPTGRMVLPSEIPAERSRLHAAIATVQAQMARELSRPDIAATDRAIVVALSEIAVDPAILDEVEVLIARGMDGVDAVLEASEGAAIAFSRIPDAYLNARADDVRAVARQLCLALVGEQDAGLASISEPCILLAEDVGAWDLARAPLRLIKGVICGHGGATSHVAIIARSHGIPAVLGMGEAIGILRTASEAALDGHSGQVFPDPAPATRRHFENRIALAHSEQERLAVYRDLRPRRADGRLIEVAANIGAIEEIEAAKAAGAMGIGLFRTELLFMRHAGLPTEDMQFEVYAQAARAFAPDPVIIRTLDIGGDKPVAGIVFPQEANPFLGWRGVRMCLDRPDVFKPQLRALLRAAVHGAVKVMLPMVSTIEEVRQTRALIEACKAELAAEGQAFADFPLGVMIETPAAVFIAPQLAKEADFFSIGTNDLTQYVMAADRLNPQIAALNDVTNPAVMAAIELTARAGNEAGIMVGMCGEAAGRPDLVERFLAMGLTELSMSPASILRTKKILAELADPGP